MCGVGGKADRRPIDPPPIVQLRVIDPTTSASTRIRYSSPTGKRSTDSGDDEDEIMDDGDRERCRFFYSLYCVHP